MSSSQETNYDYNVTIMPNAYYMSLQCYKQYLLHNTKLLWHIHELTE